RGWRESETVARAVAGARDGPADHAAPGLGPRRQLLLHDLAYDAERQLEELALVALLQARAEARQLAQRAGERRADRLELGARLRPPALDPGLEGPLDLLGRGTGRRCGGGLGDRCRRGRRAEGPEDLRHGLGERREASPHFSPVAYCDRQGRVIP